MLCSPLDRLWLRLSVVEELQYRVQMRKRFNSVLYT